MKVHHDVVIVIVNLANTTLVDWAAVSILTAIVNRLTVDLAVGNVQLVEALAVNAELTKQVTNKRSISPSL